MIRSAITCNSGGGGSYHADAVRFDVNTGFLLDPSTLPPSNLLTVVTWVKVAQVDIDDGTAPDWLRSGAPVAIGNFYDDPTDIYLLLNAHSFGSFLLRSDPGVFTGDIWHLACTSWNVSHTPGNNFGFFYFNGVSVSNPAFKLDTFDGTIDSIYWNTNDSPSPFLGGNPNIAEASCATELCDYRIWFDQCIDFSVPANLAKFLSGGKPVDPATAATAFGAPAISFTGNAASWESQATSQGFILEGDGTISNASTSPSD